MKKSLASSSPQSNSRLQLITFTLNVAVNGWKMVGGFVQNNSWNRFVTSFNQTFYDPTGSDKVLLGVEQIQCNFYDYCYSFPNNENAKGRGVMTDIFKANEDGSPPVLVRTAELELLAEKIDNAKRTHFFNTNCLSCHESSNFRNRKTILSDLESPLGITPFTTKKYVNSSPANIINFGYEGITPRISTRTASESAEVASRINAALNQKNPGQRPSDLKVLWQCLMNEKNYLTCLTKQ